MIRLLLISLLAATVGLSARADVPPAVEQADAAVLTEIESGRERVDISAMIIEHVGNSYWWHVTTIGERHLTVYLPVIVRSPHTGWHIFSSRRIAHGDEYKGFFVAADGKLTGRDAEGNEYRPWDISITKNVLALLINSAVIVVLFLIVARWYGRRSWKAAPRGFVGAVEMLTMAIENGVIKKSIGAGYERYVPYLLTAFYFILINNLMGIIPFFPGGANVTGSLSVTLVLALCTFIIVNLSSNREYWREIFWPDVPIWLKVPVPLIPLIEFFGVLSKPFALMIRLAANIMAGHIVLVAVVGIIFIAATMGKAAMAGMTVFAALFSIFMYLIEILVACLQAYVFTLLSAVFIGMARPVKHRRAG